MPNTFTETWIYTEHSFIRHRFANPTDLQNIDLQMHRFKRHINLQAKQILRFTDMQDGYKKFS